MRRAISAPHVQSRQVVLPPNQLIALAGPQEPLGQQELPLGQQELLLGQPVLRRQLELRRQPGLRRQLELLGQPELRHQLELLGQRPRRQPELPCHRLEQRRHPFSAYSNTNTLRPPG